MFSEFDGEITDRGTYLVIVTPDNPSYFWGNFLLFSDAPRKGDLMRWQQIFADEIGCRPQIEHLAFGWDSPDGNQGEIEPFLHAGFRLLQRTVLTANNVCLPQWYNANLTIRPLRTDSDWIQALETQLECDISEREHRPAFIEFTRKKMDGYRAMTEAGLGEWLGAFVGEQMAGGLGIFVKEGVGRFQEVVTRFAFRGQGVCRSLVYQASIQAFEHMGAERLVMVADDDYIAARIYEQIGFRPAERQVGVDNSQL